MKILSRQQVLRLHDDLLETFGGTAGIRDEDLHRYSLERHTGAKGATGF